MAAHFFKPVNEKLKILREERKKQEQKQNEKVIKNKNIYEQNNRSRNFQESWREKFTWVDHYKIKDLYESENLFKQVSDNFKELYRKRSKGKTENYSNPENVIYVKTVEKSIIVIIIFSRTFALR